jgi:hypothetical protein
MLTRAVAAQVAAFELLAKRVRAALPGPDQDGSGGRA